MVHPPFRWQREYARDFTQGLARMSEESDIVFAVENMYPLRAGGAELAAYAPHWNPLLMDSPHVTLDLSHTAASGSDAFAMAEELGDRLAHLHMADGSGVPNRDEHLVPGRGTQPCGPVLEKLVRTATPASWCWRSTPAGRPPARPGLPICPRRSTSPAVTWPPPRPRPPRTPRPVPRHEARGQRNRTDSHPGWTRAGQRRHALIMSNNPPAAATLITVAPTGAESEKSAVPALPVTLDELVTTAKECQAAGAAVVHVHIRDDQARPTLDLSRLKDTVAALREGTDLIVQLSTGGAVTDSFDNRLAVLDAAPDACSLTCGTVNFGEDVFHNPYPFIRDLYARTQDLGVVPEFELFDFGHIATLHRLLAGHGAPHGGHVHCDLVMGVPGRDAGGRGHADPGGLRAARGGNLVRDRDRPDHAAGHVRRARRWRPPAGRHGGHGHVRERTPGHRERRTGRARGHAGEPRPAPGDVAQRRSRHAWGERP